MNYLPGRRDSCVFALIAGVLFCSTSTAQSSRPAVPRVVSYSGKAVDAQGKPVEGTAGISFAIYRDQQGGAPLWMETQNVRADANGNYRVQLGAAKPDGLPQELFSSGEARWLGVQVNGGAEQPRVLLLSVPYALAAADAQTLGGLPPSAFMPAAGPANAATAAQGAGPLAAKAVTSAGGTAQTLAKFDSSSDIANSQIFDNGANVGIGSTAPAAKLDVNGGGIFRGMLIMPATAAATAASGGNSQPFSFTASAFSSATGQPVRQTFRWQAEPSGNNTATPAGNLNLLFGSGNVTPSETGLSIANNGIITFAPGQTFPGASSGGGTVKKVGLDAPDSDFHVSGSPVTGSGTLKFRWNTAPTADTVPNAIVKRNSSGDVSVNRISAATLVQANEIDVDAGGLFVQKGGVGSVTFANLPGTPAVSGRSLATGDGSTHGVNGFSSTNSGVGVFGNNNGTNGIGVWGRAEIGGLGVLGRADGGSGQGVWGESFGTVNSANGFGPDGVDGISHSSLGSGVAGVNYNGGVGVFGASFNGGVAGLFQGDARVTGNLSKASGSFEIDHPLDPANKYLLHSFVESPDMMNIYNGNVTTDGQGRAVVALPEWFEALNRDFRYQLTVVGQFAQAIVASKVANHSFAIQTDKPNVEVSWQVTGIRQDAWANAHRIPVERPKTENERGHYLHPELFGAPAERSIEAVHRPGAGRLAKENASRLPNAPKQ